MASAHRTSPDHDLTGWPPGVPYIIGNEGCERFSFYGMKSILTIYMVSLYAGSAAFGADPKRFATGHYHLFVASVYALPMLGAIVADRLLGKYRTIVWLSLVYCMGHGVLAVASDQIWGLWTGLGLIAIGSGGIKPCVSAHVGDQFGRSNWFRVRSVFQAFYFIINFGSFFSELLIPWTYDCFGPHLAFGIPGGLMFIATVWFWMGRNVFVHVPPKPGGTLGLLDAASSASLFFSVGHLFFSGGWNLGARVSLSVALLATGLALFAIRQRIRQDDGFLAILVYSLARHFGLADTSGKRELRPGVVRRELTGTKPESPMAKDQLKAQIEIEVRRESIRQSRFWGPAVERFGVDAAEGPPAVLRIVSVFLLVSVFWALFDQHGSSWILQGTQMKLVLFGTKILPSQVQATNPILVMILIPIASRFIYPAWEKMGFRATPLRRMTVGMILASLSFVCVALLQTRIEAKGNGVVSIGWQILPYAIITLAEVFVSITGLEFAYTQAPKRMKSTIMGFWLLAVALGNVLVSFLAGFESLPLIRFFWLFAGLMLAAGLLFGVRARFYVEQEFPQD